MAENQSPSAARPVQPLAQSLQPLEYAHLAQRRPGLITAIGVISIIVASLSIVACGVSALFAGGAYTFSKALISMSSAASATAVSTTTHATGPGGIPSQGREPIIQAFSDRGALSGGQLGQLDALLATNGQSILPGLPANATAADVAARIQDNGALPSAGRQPGGDFFALSAGRVSLHDDRAVFAPAGGGQAITVRAADVAEEPVASASAETQPAVAATPATVPATSPAVLTPAAVKAVVARAQALVRKPQSLSTAQVAGLTSLLQSPTQQLVKPASSPAAAAAQLTAVYVDSQGQAYVNFGLSSLVLSPQGQVVSQTSAGFNPFGRGQVSINSRPIVLVGLESLLSFALAIYLLIIGILTLRQSPRGASLHRMYIFLKIPLAIAGALCWMWMINTIVVGFLKAGGPMAPAASAIFWAYSTPGIVQAVLGCIYPLALIFALSGRTVREYYNYRSESAA
jgi:hypothetical protein